MIAFKNHLPINFKLCQKNFNYPKYYTISYFVKCIRHYCSAVNYNIAHSKLMNNYFFKTFYNKTYKKDYNSQFG